MYRILARWAVYVLLFLAFTGVTACGKTEISDSEHVQRAKQYQADGNLKASLIELKNALQQNAKNSEARLLLGELYILVGNGAAAEKELVRTQELGVSGVFIQKLLAESLLLQHRYTDLLDMLEKAEWTSQPELLVLRGQAQLALGKSQEAEDSFRQALRLKANTLSALLWLSRLSLASNDPRKAEGTLKKALAIDSDNSEVWVLSGRIANAEKRPDDAQSDFRHAIDLISASTPRRIEMEARTELAKLQIGQRQFADAASQVGYLLEASPHHPVTNYTAALLAYEQGQYAEARDRLLTVLKVSPNDLSSLFLLGSANYALGNLEQAEVQLARVVAVAPALLPARMMLAGIRLQQARSDQALDMLEPALAQSPGNVRLLAMAGQAALRSGELKKGRQFIQKAIAKRPDEGSLRAQLAMLYLAEGNDDQAIKELERAIEAGNASSREQSLLALTHLRRKDFDKALSAAERLVSDNPDSAYLQDLLGVIFAAKGEVTKARAAFNESRRIDPSYVTATLNLVRLDIQAGRQSDARERLDSFLVRDEKNVSAMMALAQLADLEGDRPQALQWLEKARAADMKALAPRMVLARIYLRENDLVRAREVAREALEIEPSNSRVLLIAGQIELVAQEYTAAVKSFERLAKSAPLAAADFWLGLAQLRAGEKGEARQSLDKALKLDPDHLGAADLRVVLDLDKGKTSQALSRVQEMERRHPRSPVGFEREGDIQVILKANGKAAKAYRKARLLGGGTRVVLKEAGALARSQGEQVARKLLQDWTREHADDVKARYALALAEVAAGRRQAAIAQYRHLLEVEPKNALAMNDLAWLLYQEKEPAKSLKIAEKAYQLEPENGIILDTYGWVLLDNGNAKAAVGFLRQAAEKQPGAEDVQYHYAAALVASGKRNKEARQILESILSTGRKFPEQESARKLLGSLK